MFFQVCGPTMRIHWDPVCAVHRKNAHLLKLVGSLILNAHKNHVKALAQTTDP